MAELIIFWGCQIPARLPFIEKATRKVFENLELELKEPERFTCCPESSLIKSLGEDRWRLTAARNLAVAEAVSPEAILITPCNGCSATLKSVWVELKNNPYLKAEINQQLERIGLHYQGNLKVKHLVEYLYNDVGLEKIKKQVEKPLVGLKIATHPGCHFSSPSDSVTFDDPLSPQKLDLLLAGLGAELVDYLRKRLCCGQQLFLTGQTDDSFQLTREKLIELRELEVDALATCCPACFLQFDQRQALMVKQGEELNIPVFYFTELMALSFGIELEEIGFRGHRIAVGPILKKWQESLEKVVAALPGIDLDMLRACIECGACVHDCPAALVDEKFDPQEILQKVITGKIDEVLDDGLFWACMSCHTCFELCPQNFGMDTVFAALRQLAIEQGKVPSGIQTGLEYFEKKGILAEINQRQRQKLGLPPISEPDVKELEKLFADKKKGKA